MVACWYLKSKIIAKVKIVDFVSNQETLKRYFFSFKVDNGVEMPDGHRFRVNVVEASKVDRKFNVVKKTEKQKHEEDKPKDKKENVSFQ